MLLFASYYFYMCWKMEYVLLIMCSTLVDYYAGLQMGKQDSKSAKRPYLILSLITNIGLLFSFKYFNFFNDSARLLFDQFNIFYGISPFDVLLPVGISFYTFQTLSYSIEVYNGKIKPEKHLGIFALYVSFFPQLVAGPIERPGNLLHQFYLKQEFDYKRVTDGLKLITWGFFKKLVIADRLGEFVNIVYDHPSEYQGLTLILATVFFAFQIYCDFSGYTDIARGSAQIMGFDLMQNFKRPYFSKSIGEFWRRWHISLSSWFRDYLYIPLGGNRVVKWRWYYNLIITFAISGLWHGANWTFLAWGVLHGSYLIFGIVTSNLRDRIAGYFTIDSSSPFIKFSKVIFTFSLVCIAWIFFRANTVGDAFIILQNAWHVNMEEQIPAVLEIAGSRMNLLLSIGLILFLECVHLIERQRGIVAVLSSLPRIPRWSIYCSCIWLIIYLGVFESKQFIYFQF